MVLSQDFREKATILGMLLHIYSFNFSVSPQSKDAHILSINLWIPAESILSVILAHDKSSKHYIIHIHKIFEIKNNNLNLYFMEKMSPSDEFFVILHFFLQIGVKDENNEN